MSVGTLIQVRRGTASLWTSTNPVLQDGEPGWDKDNRILKFGDGTTNWSALNGISGGGGGGGTGNVTDRGNWAATTAYNVHDLVKYGGTTWLCTVGHTSGSTFDDTKFAEQDQFRGPWLANTDYEQNDLVLQGGALWAANTTFVSGSTFNSANWTQVAGGTATTTQGSVGTNLGATQPVDFGNVSRKIVLVGVLNQPTLTITVLNRVAGCELILLLTQDVTGSRSVVLSDGSSSTPVNVALTGLTMVQVECPDATTIYFAVVGGSGMTNVMTALGDLSVGGASGTPTRLAKGADGTFLGVQSGTLGYYTPPASGQPNLARTSVKTASYTIAANDFVPVDISGGNVPLQLPTAPADKFRCEVKVIAVDGPHANTATLSRGGTDVFNKAGGSTTLTFNALFKGAILQYDLATGIWDVQSTDPGLGQPLGAAVIGTDGNLGGPGGTPLPSGLTRFPGYSPADQGLAAISGDPNGASFAQSPLLGQLYLIELWPIVARTLVQLMVSLNAAGGTLTAGQNQIGLYNAAGQLIGTCPDQTTAWAGTGPEPAALTVVGGRSLAVTPGTPVYVGLITNGTTAPKFYGHMATAPAASNMNTINFNRTGTFRYATKTGTTFTALPDPWPGGLSGSASLPILAAVL